MPAIRYEAPRSLAEAVDLIGTTPGASVMAGGTDLLVQFRAGIKQPTAFIDVKRIPDLVGIEITGDGLRLGAATAALDIARDAQLTRLWPGIAEAVALIGSTQIQGRSSVGGNLCNASPAADTPCALIVNRADCVIAGPDGERTVPAELFVKGPGKNALEPGEILVAIRVPRPEAHTADAYLRLTPRSEMDIAVVGAAVSLGLDDSGICRRARVALAAVAPTPILVEAAGQALIGTRVDADALDRLAAAARQATRPIDDKRGTIEYRRTVAGVLAKRAAAIALRRALEAPAARASRGPQHGLP
jgi:CO/xanthine dehydrogenase FAD-binding subunit